MVYVVEDDSGIREMMVYTLKATGFEAAGFPCPEQFWKALTAAKPELIILDIMLPGEDGISVLKKLRQSPSTRDIPVIMATAKGTEYDKVQGLDLGADDYLAKPFGMMEMVSRIKAVLRRVSPKTESKTLTHGNLCLDDTNHTVTVNNSNVTLTLKEYELLKLFMENPGRVFTRDFLLENLWGFGYDGETRTVDVHIRTLRSKLGAGGRCIETVRGVGYRLEAKN